MNQSKKLEELLLENAIGVEEFSHCVGIDLKIAESYLLGNKNIPKALALKIEQTFCKPKNWLDDENTLGGASYDLFG